MRHRRKGRHLGRSPSHRKAMLKNMASSLFLTERDAEFDENPPEVQGRIITTLQKAKEVRPLVEKCVTIAKKALKHQEAAAQFATSAERGSEEWRTWRKSDQWQQWNAAIAPAVAARRRVLQLIGDKQAVAVLFDIIAERFVDRPGGYTRVLRLATPRLGDAGTRAILEFVGRNDRVAQTSQRPEFGDDDETADADAQETADAPEDDAPEDDAPAETTAEAADDDAGESDEGK